MELRRFQRLPLQCPIALLINGRKEEGKIVDLSMSGCEVESNKSLQKGQELSVLLHLPDGKPPLEIKVALVRWSRGQQFGLKFLTMEPDQQARLRCFVSSLKSGPSPLSKSKGQGPTERRRAARFPVQFTVGFLGQHTVGVGSASDLSTEGCMVESELIVHQGWPLELRLRLPDDDLPVEVTLAVVRWSQGQKFGLEFLQMQLGEQERLHRFVSTLEKAPRH